jgi:hypothetical protein
MTNMALDCIRLITAEMCMRLAATAEAHSGRPATVPPQPVASAWSTSSLVFAREPYADAMPYPGREVFARLP